MASDTDSDTDERVEIVYQTDGDREVTYEADPDRPRGFPTILMRAGKLFRLVREDIVSRSGERTHSRITYRSKDEAGSRTPPA